MTVLRRMMLTFALLLGGGVAAADAAPEMEPVHQAVCRLIENSARANGLPIAFMTRVIWRESSFRAHVVSPVGAQGIAQFMPSTAAERGLADPFDPEQAIPKAARLLGDLKRQFGTLARAAAAYNAGPARVSKWLAGETGLPAETRAYVLFVTQGTDEGAGSATSTQPGAQAAVAESAASCVEVVAALRRSPSPDDGPLPPMWAPWGVQLAGNFSKPLALASFERARNQYGRIIGPIQPMIIGRVLRSRGTRPFYQIRIPAETRAYAEALCGRIQSIGGACVAMRS
jgi:hypothetical protein